MGPVILARMSDADEFINKIEETLPDRLESGVDEFTTEGGKHTKLIPLDQLLDARDRLKREQARNSRSIFQRVRRIDG